MALPAPARNRSALLVLEDGRTFRGESFGAEGETFGEAVFSTGMSGYQETLTDPSYHRQVVVMTAPHVGNTGMNDEDMESSRIWVAGYVVRDPAATTQQVALLQALLGEGVPYFGICFGNQLFGRALGFGTYKLKYGHRGINQPVMDRTTGKVEVTAHHHGFAVDAPLEGSTRTDHGVATVSHVCLNDDVVEGLELRDADGRLTSFSVQYHPEAAAGPHDAAYLFDRFADLMTDRKDA